MAGRLSPDEPLAVIAAGPVAAPRTAVLAALLDTDERVLRVPEESFLVVSSGSGTGAKAYVPGVRDARVYRAGTGAAESSDADDAESGGRGSAGGEPRLARPPRRVELYLPQPLLRHFSVVDTPESGRLGHAGVQVVLEAVERAGALLFVIPAEQDLAMEQRFSAADVELLSAAADGRAKVFFVVTPAAFVPSESEALAWRAEVEAAVPALVDASWIEADPAHGDVATLSRALVDWASDESIRRASSGPPREMIMTAGPIRVAAGADESGWREWLERAVRTNVHRIRRNLALEGANIHLRCVQELVFGTGCAGLSAALDRELHALSLQAVAECDGAMDGILGEAIVRVFGENAGEEVRHRLVTWTRRHLGGHRAYRSLDRVLLVNSKGDVTLASGVSALSALAAYPGNEGAGILPPIGVGVHGSCYQYWGDPANDEVSEARTWVQRVIWEIDLELLREVARRFEALEIGLGRVLSDAVEQGALLP